MRLLALTSHIHSLRPDTLHGPMGPLQWEQFQSPWRFVHCLYT